MTSAPPPQSRWDDESEAAEARRLAARALGERPGPDAPERLMAALADPDWRVRKEAASAAVALSGDARVVERLSEALLQPDEVGLRNAAIEAFVRIGPRAATALIDALERATATARKFVVAAMAGAGEQVVPALARLAGDPDPNTATVALESLARIGGDGAEDALRKQLEASDWVVRLAALEGLAALGARAPVSLLAPMVTDPLVRRFALRLLGRSCDPDAVAPLVATLGAATGIAEVAEIALALIALHEADERAAASIAREARRLSGADRALLRQPIATDTGNTEEELPAQRAAATLLLLARDVQALPAISALAARAELGPAALAALRAFGAEAVRPLLSIEPALDPPARAWALEAAAELATMPLEAAPGDDERAPDPELGREVHAALRAALDARDEVVVQAAARALSIWAEPGDAPTLVKLGSTRGGAVARATSTALEALSHSAPHSVEIALDDASPDRADAWSEAVAALAPEVALEKLRAAIASGEASARRAALLALDRVDSAEAAEVASMALADEDVDVQVAAVSVLARMRHVSARAIAAATLPVALRDESPAVRAAAARAIGALGDPEVRGRLRDLLRDPGPGVALAALSSLRALGGAEPASEPDLEELLVDVLGHPDQEVVKEGLRVVAEKIRDRREARLAIGLSHPAWDVRRLAAALLGAIGSEGALSHLRARRAIETDDLVRAAIDDALDPAKAGGAGA
ncbi:HEAT repeat domain-containing protein [Sandaracinus amylolyticus]|uniref:HEAT repeat protein n=1 Tax=Sandaracinus amylolyticus TaxID=927083 RepID=A0A0F6YLP6_9BACT|nr:HEAT repeat domain-containing protein [Sandaracinus amylolyticus]AKF08566.1 HEAT repeat protein [Sandaracinus amylolyticus]